MQKRKEIIIDWGTLINGFIEIFIVKIFVHALIALVLPGLALMNIFIKFMDFNRKINNFKWD